MKHPGGRPLKFETPEDLKNVIEKYFKETPQSEYSVTGLAMSVGSKQLIQDYEKREGYKEIVQYAKLVIENSYELDLRKKGGAHNIFALKNFGWSDRQEITGADGKDLPTPIIPINVHTNNSNEEDHSAVKEDSSNSRGDLGE